MSLSNRLKKVGTNTINTGTGFSNRSDSELKIGLNNKSFIDSKFTRLIEAPTMKGDYYQLDPNSSSFSENLKLVKDPSKSLFFNLIENFVMYNLSPSEETDPKDDQERGPIINLSNKTVVILAGTIRPKEGDCFVLYSHQNIKRVFQVSKVDEKMLIDREVYEVQFIESQMWLYEEIQKQVVGKFTYLESNVGSGNKVIIENNTVHHISRIQEVLKDLNNQYIESFYNETFDSIGIKDLVCEDSYFTVRSLSKFQMNTGVLRYGFDSNMLFINNDYLYKNDEINYNRSIYKSIIRKSRIKSEEVFDSNFGQEHKSTFNIKMQEFERYSYINNQDRDVVIEGDSRMRYYLKFYYRSIKDHMVMTNMFNSKLELVELLESNPNLYINSKMNNNNVVEEPYYKFILNNSLYNDLMLKYHEYLLSPTHEGFKNMFQYITVSLLPKMMNYDIYNNDLTDLIFFPVLKYIVEECIDEITKDKMFTSY